jgi:LPXTG-site transpeptidase (sortase) family protein
MVFVTGAPVRAETNEPRQIVIPRLGIDLPVHIAKIVFDTWEVHMDGASFGEGSILPGKVGNTIIFSHAMPFLFGDLPKIQKNDYIHVFTDNDWYVYKVYKTEEVEPTQTDVLDSHSIPELTLYTCVGPNYSLRFIVKAKLMSGPSFY